MLDNNAAMLGLVAMSEEGQNLNYAVTIDVIKEFVTNSLTAKSRGAESRSETEKGSRYSGSAKGGFSVTKTVYSNLVSYTVRDAKGVPVEQITETSEGAILTGSKSNAFGGFSEWIFKPSSGRTVSVRSSGIAPDILSFTAGN